MLSVLNYLSSYIGRFYTTCLLATYLHVTFFLRLPCIACQAQAVEFWQNAELFHHIF